MGRSTDEETQMNPFAAIAVKTVGAGTAAAMLSLGVAGVLAQAAPSPSPSPTASANQPKPDAHRDRRLVFRAVFESEADVLHMTAAQLREDLKHGLTVEQLAKTQGMNKEQFAARLVVKLKPRLEDLVEHKVITKAQADKVLDRIAHGYIPFWNGIPHRTAASPAPTK
jgi:uncharacterized protein YaiL (DUF2058 family)